MIRDQNEILFHEPVMVDEIIKFLRIEKLALLKSQAQVIDATLGSAGHSIEIINKGGNVLAIELDPEMRKVSETRLKKACPILNGKVEDCFKIAEGSFRDIDKIAEREGFVAVDGIIFDLGISNLHLESSERGFSFKNQDAPLDMRINQESQNIKASDLVNVLRKDQLTQLFSNVYTRNLSEKIAKEIVLIRKEKKILTVGDLTETLKSIKALQKAQRKSKLHPATKAMLALRIAVNSELENLDEAIPKAFSLLKKGGRLLVISFHSGEDKIVKNHFKSLEEKGVAKLITKKPIEPKSKEILKNPKSRSAKMRVIEKI